MYKTLKYRPSRLALREALKTGHSLDVCFSTGSDKAICRRRFRPFVVNGNIRLRCVVSQNVVLIISNPDAQNFTVTKYRKGCKVIQYPKPSIYEINWVLPEELESPDADGQKESEPEPESRPAIPVDVEPELKTLIEANQNTINRIEELLQFLSQAKLSIVAFLEVGLKRVRGTNHEMLIVYHYCCRLEKHYSELHKSLHKPVAAEKFLARVCNLLNKQFGFHRRAENIGGAIVAAGFFAPQHEFFDREQDTRMSTNNALLNAYEELTRNRP